jgi:hypothetical protein
MSPWLVWACLRARQTGRLRQQLQQPLPLQGRQTLPGRVRQKPGGSWEQQLRCMPPRSLAAQAEAAKAQQQLAAAQADAAETRRQLEAAAAEHAAALQAAQAAAVQARQQLVATAAEHQPVQSQRQAAAAAALADAQRDATTAAGEQRTALVQARLPQDAAGPTRQVSLKAIEATHVHHQGTRWPS